MTLKFLLSSICVLVAGSLAASDVIVVCRSDWQNSLRPWMEMRQNEGLSIAVVPPSRTAEATRLSIVAAADETTRYVVLVGDCAAIGQPTAEAPVAESIPTFYRPAAATLAHGSTPVFPTDLPYGDLDGDAAADAAVGRLPVASASQLDELLLRIAQYERSTDFGDWRGSLQLTGGIGGFGGMVDGAIETVTRSVLTSVLPPDAKPRIAYASPGHPFCPPEESFPDAVVDRYRDGARFWVYAGHGRVDRLDYLKRSKEDAAALGGKQRSPWSVHSLLSNDSAERLSGSPSRASVAVLLACYVGAFDAPGDCLAERMLIAPGGPIAVIASSRLSMPYGNARWGLGLLQAVYQDRAVRLGDATLRAAQRMDAPPNPEAAGIVMMVDGLATMLSPAGTDLSIERREHASMYALLGDPTLRLHPPEPIEVSIIKPIAAPSLSVLLTSPVAGPVTLSVDRPLGDASQPHGPTLASVQDAVKSGQVLTMRIPLPEGTSGPLVVRASVAGEDRWASGAVRTVIRVPTNPNPTR